MLNSEMNIVPEKIVKSISGVSPVLTSTLRSLRHQLSHPQEIIGSAHKPRCQLSLSYPFKSCPPKTANCLYPAINFFYLLPNSLADTISDMPGRPPIDCRTTFSFGIGRHVRSNFLTTQQGNKTTGIISFIPSQGLGSDPTTARNMSMTMRHPSSAFSVFFPHFMVSVSAY